MIYLDYAATTPVDPRVAEKMHACLTEVFANPSSVHAGGKEARAAVENARHQVADLIDAEADEIIWTSGATEADNLALKGAAQLYQQKGRHIVTVKTEHQAVLDTCQQLEKTGFTVTYLTPEADGLLDSEKLMAALRTDTILISVMHVNNETGVIQDIKRIAEMTSSRGILFHIDAAQSAGKIPLSVKKIPADFISFSAHKIYGPKGIGALYVRKKPRVRVAAQIHGGGHEQGMRSGTLPTHQIAGMGEAFAIAKKEMQKDYQKVQQLRDFFVTEFSSFKKIMINGNPHHTVPFILNITIPDHSAEKLLSALPDIAFSRGAACDAKSVEPSYVLRAMGLSTADAHCSVRFSFGRFTTMTEINDTLVQLKSFILGKNHDQDTGQR